jgi:hypothetical protein
MRNPIANEADHSCMKIMQSYRVIHSCEESSLYHGIGDLGARKGEEGEKGQEG